MKKITMLFALAVLCISLSAQNEKSVENPRNNQINLGYFNVLHLSGNNSFGIGYKYNVNNGAIRTGVGFGYRHSIEDFETSDMEMKSNYTRIEPRLGYEFHMDFNRWQFYYGADLLTSITSSKTTEKDLESGLTQTRRDDGVGVGFGPFIGLKYQINKYFSIATETNFEVMYSKSKRVDESSSGIENKRTRESISTGINPLGLVSLNIHF